MIFFFSFFFHEIMQEIDYIDSTNAAKKVTDLFWMDECLSLVFPSHFKLYLALFFLFFFCFLFFK